MTGQDPETFMNVWLGACELREEGGNVAKIEQYGAFGASQNTFQL